LVDQIRFPSLIDLPLLLGLLAFNPGFELLPTHFQLVDAPFLLLATPQLQLPPASLFFLEMIHG